MISKHVMRELLEQAINMHAERFERYGMSTGPLQFNLVNMIELNLGRQAGPVDASARVVGRRSRRRIVLHDTATVSA